MMITATDRFAPPVDRPASRGRECPFHAGAETIDLLLAEIDPRDTALFDAVLDLRCICAAGEDALACAGQLFRVRALLEEKHYLAFYRVRCWAQRALQVHVRAWRGAPVIVMEFPRGGARLEEVVNAALARVADDAGRIPPTAQVRFVFAAVPSRQTADSR